MNLPPGSWRISSTKIRAKNSHSFGGNLGVSGPFFNQRHVSCCFLFNLQEISIHDWVWLGTTIITLPPYNPSGSILVNHESFIGWWLVSKIFFVCLSWSLGDSWTNLTFVFFKMGWNSTPPTGLYKLPICWDQSMQVYIVYSINGFLW